MRKTHCFYPPFASSLSQTPALKAVVASTILNNIQSEKARLRSARSVSPASLHCGRPYSADRGRHGSGEKSSQNSISRSHPFPQKGSKRYSESYFTPQTGPKPRMRFSPACGPCFRTEKTRKLIIWSGRRHVRTPSTEILLFSRHQEKEKKRYIEAVTPLLPGKPSYHIGWLRICDEARAKPFVLHGDLQSCQLGSIPALPEDTGNRPKDWRTRKRIAAPNNNESVAYPLNACWAILLDHQLPAFRAHVDSLLAKLATTAT